MDFALMFDCQHMQEGLLCMASIQDRSPASKVYVLCLQDTVGTAVVKQGGIPVDRSAIEAMYPQIAETLKTGRPWAPYTQSLKPFLLEYLFLKHRAQVVTYVDSDMYFWGDPQEIDREFAEHSFMVTPFSQRINLCHFSGACFACRNDEKGKALLRWWQDRCVEWCLWQPGPNGEFGEEGYLNIIRSDPTKFQGTHVCEHPGINLSPWRLQFCDIQKSDVGLSVNGYPLVCFHYQGYNKVSEEYEAPEGLSPEASELLYWPYHLMLPMPGPLVPINVHFEDREPQG